MFINTNTQKTILELTIRNLVAFLESLTATHF